MQVHYVPGRNHWVTSSYFDGMVKLYDRLFNGKLTPNIELQLVQLYHPVIRDCALVVTAEPVQLQVGGEESGVFKYSICILRCSGHKHNN